MLALQITYVMQPPEPEVFGKYFFHNSGCKNWEINLCFLPMQIRVEKSFDALSLGKNQALLKEVAHTKSLCSCECMWTLLINKKALHKSPMACWNSCVIWSLQSKGLLPANPQLFFQNAPWNCSLLSVGTVAVHERRNRNNQFLLVFMPVPYNRSGSSVWLLNCKNRVQLASNVSEFGKYLVKH